jgi:hypothetical protein
MYKLVLVLMLVFSGGCSVGDEHLDPSGLGASDDVNCRDFGLVPGTETYAKCRAQMERERSPKAPAAQ